MPTLARKNAMKHKSACVSKSAANISATHEKLGSQVINNTLLICLVKKAALSVELEQCFTQILKWTQLRLTWVLSSLIEFCQP
jgi:hypothetical protein